MNKKHIISILATILSLTILCCAAKKPARPAHGPHEQYGGRASIVKRDIPYASGVMGDRKLKLDVYSNPHEEPWPVAVVVHGGSWMEGDKNNDNKVYNCKVMANNGYVAFSINYRLAPAHKIKKQVEDAMAAVIWVKEHAAEYGGNPDRIGIIGGSAGGLIAALVAWASDDPYFTPTGNPKSKYDSDVDAAALYYPVININETLKTAAPGVYPVARIYLAGRLTKKQMDRISPHTYIDGNIPPTMFLTGDADELNLYQQSVKYEIQLRKYGVPTRLFTAFGKKHAFTWQYWEKESVDSAMAVVDFFDKYVR